MTALDQPTCVVELDGRLTVAPFPVTHISDVDGITRIEMLEPVGLAARSTEIFIDVADRTAEPSATGNAPTPPPTSDGIVLWAEPVLLGAELVGMFDTTDGHALVRAISPRAGHIDLIVGEVIADDAVHASGDPRAIGLGRITDVEESDDEIALSGAFGRVRIQSRPSAVFTDRWRGTVPADADLGESDVAAEQLAAAILEHGDIQVTVTRIAEDRTPCTTVLCARGAHAVSVRRDADAESDDLVIFHSADLAMRTLEVAGLLAGPLLPVGPPATDDVTGRTTVSIARRTSGGVVGGVESWFECGASGWVQLLEDRTEQPVEPGGDGSAASGAPAAATGSTTTLIRTPRSVLDVIALLNEHATSSETR